MSNLLLKTNGGRDKRPNFVFGSLESALIVSAWAVLDCGKKSYLGPAEIPFFVFLI